MSKKECWLLVGAILLFVGAIGACYQRDELKKEAISLGHAQYNPQTGQFQWKTNTVKPRIMMTLDEMKLAVCQKLPQKILRIHNAEIYEHELMWILQNGNRGIDWPTEGLQVCHDAEKLLGHTEWRPIS